MNKRYEQRSILCPGCHFFWKAGIRTTAVGDVYFPEGCLCYGYSFHDEYEPSEECDGFITEEQYLSLTKQRELLKKKRKK